MAALRASFRVQVQLLVGTGMRLGESEGLRVADLRLGDRDNRAMIEDAKTSTGVRVVFVPAWCAAALAGHNRARELLGLADYTIHGHRHTAAVHLARAGMPLHLLQQQLGHKNIEMTMKYTRFHPDYNDVAGYFDRVGDRLGLGAHNRTDNTPLAEEPAGATPETT